MARNPAIAGSYRPSSFTLPLRRATVARRGGLTSAIRRQLTGGRPPSRALIQAFALCNDELCFARSMLERGTRYWLFRSNQRLFCGDFVIVDMSPRHAGGRRSWVVDLKLGAELSVGGGGAGMQLINSRHAIAHIAWTTGAISPESTPELLAGDRRAVLARLGVV